MFAYHAHLYCLFFLRNMGKDRVESFGIRHEITGYGNFIKQFFEPNKNHQQYGTISRLYMQHFCLIVFSPEGEQSERQDTGPGGWVIFN